jgi:hypothetical protein
LVKESACRQQHSVAGGDFGGVAWLGLGDSRIVHVTAVR